MAQTTITEKEKNGMDIFDILGPVMVGPSSSHTAGAARIGAMARTLLGEEVTARLPKRERATAPTVRSSRDCSA